MRAPGHALQRARDVRRAPARARRGAARAQLRGRARQQEAPATRRRSQTTLSTPRPNARSMPQPRRGHTLSIRVSSRSTVLVSEVREWAPVSVASSSGRPVAKALVQRRGDVSERRIRRVSMVRPVPKEETALRRIPDTRNPRPSANAPVCMKSLHASAASDTESPLTQAECHGHPLCSGLCSRG